MAVLEPKMAILDETDSGLDIDALRIVADGVNKHVPLADRNGLAQPIVKECAIGQSRERIVVREHPRRFADVVPGKFFLLEEDDFSAFAGKDAGDRAASRASPHHDYVKDIVVWIRGKFMHIEGVSILLQKNHRGDYPPGAVRCGSAQSFHCCGRSNAHR